MAVIVTSCGGDDEGTGDAGGAGETTEATTTRVTTVVEDPAVDVASFCADVGIDTIDAAIRSRGADLPELVAPRRDHRRWRRTFRR